MSSHDPSTVSSPRACRAIATARSRPSTCPDRRWPSPTITAAPRWLSTDLRDGNQALIDPMNTARKQAMFDLLVKMGYKEIEVGFPAASQTDFDFIRSLIESGADPRRRPHLGADPGPRGAHRAHRAVAGRARAGHGAHVQRRRADVPQRRVRLATATGAAQCKAVAVDGTQRGHEVRRDLPGRHRLRLRVLARDLHGHRARLLAGDLRGGDGRLAAGAGPRDRAQPAVHGRALHPERLRRPDRVDEPQPDAGASTSRCRCTPTTTAARPPPTPSWPCWPARSASRAACSATASGRGNVDLVTLGLNLYSQGIDPMIDFSDIDEIRRTAEYCNRIGVHERHPYAGDLVYTSFSGSHQDAIKKGFDDLDRRPPRPGGRSARCRGRCRTCRSTPRTSAAPTRPSSGSTRSPARAASPTS